MYCKYLNLRNNEELAQITMRKRNSTLNQSTLNCPGLQKKKHTRVSDLYSDGNEDMVATLQIFRNRGHRDRYEQRHREFRS